MSIFRQVSTQVRNFYSNESGNVLMMTALTFPVLAVVAGVALDFSRVASVKTKTNDALDSAILAMGNNYSRGEPVNQEAFQEFFEANFIGRSGILPEYTVKSFSADKKTGEISASIETSINAGFMRVAGYENIKIGSSGTAIFKQTDTEIAMMLDITGSMRGSKIASLKNAANNALDILLSDTNKNTTRVGLVPYASSINVGKTIAAKVTKGNDTVEVAGAFEYNNQNVNPAGNVCVTERTGENGANDVSYKITPVGSDWRTVNGAVETYYGNGAPKSERLTCPKASLMPLTNQKNSLKQQINKMQATGYTAGHLGVAWSYYMLSENWKDAFGSAAAKPYSKDTNKIAIIMTDGSFNTFYNGIEGKYAPFGDNADESSTLARDLCTDMKALKSGQPGITIYSVAFSAPKDAQELLRDCASDDTATQTYYYSADNGAELEAAFASIANSIQTLRLSK